MYAVKTNPSKFVLRTIYKFGIKSFDAASLTEIKLIKSLFNNAIIYFMNPIKSRHAIKEAYFNYGVKHFSLDSFEELKKIGESTNFPNDLNLHLRISIPNNFSKIKLTKKFGVDGNKAKVLLNEIKKFAKKNRCLFSPWLSMYECKSL